jgi:COP9 signalosome complex subunit 3
MQVCLLSKCYNTAVSILNDEIYDVNQDLTGVTAKDMLLYYYYGGMVYTGLKEYKRALIFFKTVVTAPAVVLSSIMVEAYKKYILLSLIVHGKILSLPRYTSSVVQRYHKTSFPQYQEFATAFGTHSTDDLHKVAELHAEIFHKDKNFGLVKQCIQSLYSKNIQRHTQTYLTFSLQDMAASAKLRSPQEAEKHVLHMIEKGEIFASINQKDGTVSFQEDPENYDTKTMTTYLDRQVQKVIELGQKVRAIDETIASSPHYLQRTSVHERGRWGEFGEEFEGAEKVMSGVPGKLM